MRKIIVILTMFAILLFLVIAVFSACAVSEYYSCFENDRWYADWRRIPLKYPYSIIESGEIVRWDNIAYPTNCSTGNVSRLLFIHVCKIDSFSYDAKGVWGTFLSRGAKSYFYLNYNDRYAEIFDNEEDIVQEHANTIQGGRFELAKFDSQFKKYWSSHRFLPIGRIVLAKLLNLSERSGLQAAGR